MASAGASRASFTAATSSERYARSATDRPRTMPAVKEPLLVAVIGCNAPRRREVHTRGYGSAPGGSINRSSESASTGPALPKRFHTPSWDGSWGAGGLLARLAQSPKVPCLRGI
jgi:hypothetical protein